MKILDVSSAVMPVPTAKKNSAGGSGFDMLMAQAASNPQNTEAEQTRTGDTGRERNENRTEGTSRNDQSDRRRENRTDEAPAANCANTVEQTEEATYVPIDEAQAAAVIAEILQLPAEVVAELLAQLDIAPQELADPANVAKLLQSALGAETPAELLNNPQFPELYKEINAAVAELVAKAETAKNTAIETAKHIPADKINESLATLDVSTENGEVVVKNAEPAKTTDTTPLRTQTQASSNKAEQAAPQAKTEQAASGTYAELGAATAEADIADAPVAANPVQQIQTDTPTQQPIQQAATPTPVNAADVIEQIMSQVKVSNTGASFTEIRVTLRPETLGDIVLRVMTQNGIVTAMFEAENQRVKEALEAGFNQLRDALTESGISFSELSVYVRQDENERMSQFERAAQNARARAEGIAVEEELPPEEISYHNGAIDVTA